MKKKLLTLILVVTFFALGPVLKAEAVENGTVKVGLRQSGKCGGRRL